MLNLLARAVVALGKVTIGCKNFTRKYCMNNLEKSKYLHKKATELLTNTLLPYYLQKYGEIIYTGSYDLDLMVWADIDLQIILPNDKSKSRLEMILDISNAFLLDSNCKNIKLINFSLSNKPNMPKGMYLGVNFKQNDTQIVWKIDVCALDEEDQKKSYEFHKQLKERLTPELSDFILQWKFKIMTKCGMTRMPQLSSYFLYQAILIYNLRTDQEIWNFLEKNGVVI